MGFEPTISEGERPQTYALQRGHWDRHLLEYNLEIHRRTANVIHLLNTKFNEKYKMAGIIVVFPVSLLSCSHNFVASELRNAIWKIFKLNI